MIIFRKSIMPVVIFILIAVSFFCDDTGFIPPSEKFNLSGWKLQIPGPMDIPDLSNYASKYFYLDNSNDMCFWIDASEKGRTKNSTYVRSELRHIRNWNIDTNIMMSAVINIESRLNPDKVTVLQIHGITDDNDNAPPLLRIALNDGSLYAFIKKDKTGDKTESFFLASGIKTEEFAMDVKLKNAYLFINVNGLEKIKKDLSFWKYKSYFKAGAYAQSHMGTVRVSFKSLSVKEN